MEAVWDFAYYGVVFIEDCDIAPGALRVEPVNGRHLDARVYQPEFLGCLHSEDLIRLNDSDTSLLGAVIQCDQTLHPSLARACWRDHYKEGVLV